MVNFFAFAQHCCAVRKISPAYRLVESCYPLVVKIDAAIFYQSPAFAVAGDYAAGCKQINDSDAGIHLRRFNIGRWHIGGVSASAE